MWQGLTLGGHSVPVKDPFHSKGHCLHLVHNQSNSNCLPLQAACRIAGETSTKSDTEGAIALPAADVSYSHSLFAGLLEQVIKTAKQTQPTPEFLWSAGKTRSEATYQSTPISTPNFSSVCEGELFLGPMMNVPMELRELLFIHYGNNTRLSSLL